MEKNKVKINICNTDYTIISEDSPEYVLSIAEEVDKEMNNILKNNTRFSVTMVAVLSALQYCDDLHKSIRDCDNIRNQLRDYLEDNASLKIEVNKMKEENVNLKKEIQSLRKRLSNEPSSSYNGKDVPLVPVPLEDESKPTSIDFDIEEEI